MMGEKVKKGKIGTMMAYKDALSIPKRFRGGNIRFSDVDYSFLKGLENNLYERGCTAGGIGARMRSVKAVYYEGLRRGYATR